MDIKKIVSNYNDTFIDDKRCFCHASQNIKFSKEEIDLFHLNETIPDVQFLLALHYFYNDNSNLSLYFANMAVSNEILLANNIIALLSSDSDREKLYLDCIKNDFGRSYLNLVNYYFKNDKLDLSKKFSQIGIQKGFNCCESFYLIKFCENDSDFQIKLLEVANKGCLTAIDEIFKLTEGLEEKIKIMKIGERFGYNESIIFLIKQYKISKPFKFERYLQQYKSSDNFMLLKFIAQEYFSIGKYEKSKKIYYNLMNKDEKILDFILNNDKLINFKKIYKFLKKKKDKTDNDKTNIILCLINLGENEKILDIIFTIKDAYFKNLSLYIYTKNILGKINEAGKYLTKLKELGYENDSLYYELGSYYESKGKDEKAIKNYLIAKQKGSKKSINKNLATIYLRMKNYKEAYKHLCSSKENFDNKLLENFIKVYCDNKIAKKLIKNNIYEGINYLIKQDFDKKNIIDLALNNLIFELNTDCPICFNDEKYFLTLQCNHNICVNCIFKYTTKFNICPFCNSKKVMEGIKLI